MEEYEYNYYNNMTSEDYYDSTTYDENEENPFDKLEDEDTKLMNKRNELNRKAK